MAKKLLMCLIIAILLMAALPASAATGDMNYIPLRDIMQKTDYLYNEKANDGSFLQLVLNGTQMETDPLLGVYFVGDYGTQLVRPAYFMVLHTDTTMIPQPMDNNHIMLYVNSFMKELLAYEGYEFLNPDVLDAYNNRMGYTGQAKDILFTINVAEYHDDIVDINCFGMMSMVSQNADNPADQIINDEVYAVMRQIYDTQDGMLENCYLITDQEDVYKIIETLREGGAISPDYWANGWLERHRK